MVGFYYCGVEVGKIHDYDIVIGAMADDQIYNYISDYMDGSNYPRAVLDIGKIQISNTSNCILYR